MTTVSQPKVNITKASASQIISNAPQRVLIVGQQTGAVYTSGDLVKDIGNANIEINNFGLGSHVAQMVRAFKTTNQVTAIDAIPLDDAGAAVSATGTVTFTGPSTEVGTIEVSVGSERNHKYSIAIASGDTATIIGDALVAAIVADTSAIVSSVNAAGVVTLTAKNGGTIGNTIGIKFEGIVAGVAVVTVAMASGATDPVLTNIFDVVGSTRYQTVVFPGNYDETVLTDFLDARFNAQNEILDGVGVISKTDTLANLKTFLGTKNSKSLIVHSNEKVDTNNIRGSALFEWDDVIASLVGALRSIRLTDGSNLSRVVIANNLDLIGGVRLSSLPYHNTPVFELPVMDTGLGFTDIEVGEINDAGGFVLGNNVVRTNILIDEVFTTYKTDVAGNPDITYEVLNRVDISSNVAEFYFNNLRADYAQYRLTDGAIPPGSNTANAATIRSSFVEYYETLSGPDYVLLRAGTENLKYFVDNLMISLDLQEGKVTSIQKIPFVGQLRQLDVILEPVLNIN